MAPPCLPRTQGSLVPLGSGPSPGLPTRSPDHPEPYSGQMSRLREWVNEAMDRGAQHSNGRQVEALQDQFGTTTLVPSEMPDTI
jgi:hypothetical protein